MTLREKIADWISGGELSGARAAARANWNSYRSALAIAHVSRDHLRRVAAQETPKCNATVKRMARIAREGLNDGDGGRSAAPMARTKGQG